MYRPHAGHRALHCGQQRIFPRFPNPRKGELTSLYTTYKANIGFLDPFEVQHFLATGVAATNIVADPDVLKYLSETDEEGK